MQTAAEVAADPACMLDMPALIRQRVAQAASLRRALGLPSPATTDVYRLLNSEGDRLPGLVTDVLGGCAVVQGYAAWCETNRPAIEEAVMRESGCGRVVWRRSADMLAKEGLTLDEGDAPVADDLVDDPDAPLTSSQDTSIVCENGIRYYASPYGQKTGFYADQRDNRCGE